MGQFHIASRILNDAIEKKKVFDRELSKVETMRERRRETWLKLSDRVNIELAKYETILASIHNSRHEEEGESTRSGYKRKRDQTKESSEDDDSSLNLSSSSRSRKRPRGTITSGTWITDKELVYHSKKDNNAEWKSVIQSNVPSELHIFKDYPMDEWLVNLYNMATDIEKIFHDAQGSRRRVCEQDYSSLLYLLSERISLYNSMIMEEFPGIVGQDLCSMISRRYQGIERLMKKYCKSSRR